MLVTIKNKYTAFATWSVMAMLLVFIQGCDNKKGDETPAFDRQGLNQKTAEFIIIPSYDQYHTALNSFESSVDAFFADATEARLVVVREDLKTLRKDWQYCSFYNFGPALDASLLSFTNIFPVNTGTIETNIANGGYNLSSIATKDQQGLQALGYLFYGESLSNAAIVESYTTGPFAAERKQYVSDILNSMDTSIETVRTGWVTYKDVYGATSKSGTDAGSSLSLLLNEWNKYFEVNLRDAKIGIPVGERTLQQQQPTKVEALYAGYSTELALHAVQAYEDLYLGKSIDGETVTSLDNYVQAISAKTVIDGSDLSKSIKSQFSVIKSALGNVQDPLSEEVETNQSGVKTVFTEMQKLIVFIKSDLTSAMGISISYIDNDGD